MKAHISYFTGTGNSLRAADLCRLALAAAGYETVLSEIRRDSSPNSMEGELFGLCCPVYSLGAPRIVREYLGRLPRVDPPRRAFVLVTAGDERDVGWSLQEAAAALASKGFDVVAADAVEMPNNWLPFSYVPTAEEAGGILQKAEGLVVGFVTAMLAGRRIHRLGVKRLWFLFRAGEGCTGCGQCARICPTASIRMKAGRPRWSRTCEQCMRCIHFCPSRAITQLESLGKGSTRNRYHEPHFRPAGLAAS